MVKKNKISVASYLEQQIAMSPKSQKDIADACGYDKANIITMIKQGKTKLPINKIGPIANALGIDPVHLLRLTLEEYMPETWETIQSLIGQSLVSKDEVLALTVLRKVTGGVDLDYSDPKLYTALSTALKPLIEREMEGREDVAKSVRVKR